MPPVLRARLAPLLLGGLLGLAACGDDAGAGPNAVASLAIADTGFAFVALGQNHLFSATARSAGGERLDGVAVQWSSSDPGVLQVNGDGLATAVATGSVTLVAAADDARDSVTVVVDQVPASLTVVFGDRQSSNPGGTLPTPLTVQVTDALRHPIPGVDVQFTAGPEGGSVGSPAVTTDFLGIASSDFTLGAATGGYTVTASVAGTALAAGFTLRTAGPFDLELLWLSPASPGVQGAFADAEERWEAIIAGDLPDDYALVPAFSCGSNPDLDRSLDDLLIFVTIAPIDGPGGILGQAGPCYYHSVGGLPAIGDMYFDEDDLASLQQAGQLQAVVLHEMGHVLGFGTHWDALGLLAEPALQGGLDPHFTGAQAIAAFDLAGGTGYAAGAKVPVEDQYGPGTADGHWRESVFLTELMTGLLDYGVTPLSAVTLASFADLGYAVDTTQAEPFALAAPSALPAAARRLHFGPDLLHYPPRRLDPRARIRPPYLPPARP